MTATTTSNYGTTTGASASSTTAKVRTFTETKAGTKTTEFFLTLLFVAGSLIAAYARSNDSFNVEDGWRFASIAVAAYIVSRGLAKLGIREPYTDEIDVR